MPKGTTIAIIGGGEIGSVATERYFKTTRFAQGPLTVDADKGIIKDIVLCQAGEARGHGVFLEQEFIDELVRLGAEFKDQGIKSRFGHPSMSNTALGTCMGRIKNIRALGDKAIGDLHLFEASKKSPTHGDMFSYVLMMAQEAPESCGFSIVFVPGPCYYKDIDGNKLTPGEDGQIDQSKWDGKRYTTIKELFGCDLEDEGAATKDGMFSAGIAFNTDKFAVIATQFLLENPQVAEFMEKHPEKINEFFSKHFKKPLSIDMTKPAKKSFWAKMFSAFKEFAIQCETEKGDKILIDTESDAPAVGDSVLIDDGSGNPAPAGDHVIKSENLKGYTITVDESGTITAIQEPKTGDNPDEVPADAELKKKFSAMEATLEAEKKAREESEKKFKKLQEDFEAWKKAPADKHTNVIAEADKVNGGETKQDSVWSQPHNQVAAKMIAENKK
jgi:chromatin segregation and condensation protein Rec8/ScpA/Scc1 (kleisin family)